MWHTGRDGEGSGIHNGVVVERHFTSLHTFDIAWKCGKTPHECREAIIVPIYKKGSRDECSNYRRISLLSVVGKIYAMMVVTG